jgi:uncharacterized protein DUF3159
LIAPATAMAPPVAYGLAYRRGAGFAVALGIVVSLIALGAEKRLTGRQRWSWLGVGGIVLSGGLVLITGNGALFFVRSIGLRAAWGAVFVVSVLIGRPAVGAVAGWLMSPGLAREQALTHRDAFSFVTLVWGIAELLKAAARGYAMATGSLDRLTVVVLATGYPVEAGLAVFSLWFLRRAGVTLREPIAQPDGR